VNAETQHLRALAARVVAAATAELDVRAALLAGSAARGDADRFSDVDLLFYVDALPSQAEVRRVPQTVDGVDPLSRFEPTEYATGVEFALDGVRTEVSFTTVERVERQLDELLVELVDVASPRQKLLAGLAEGQALHGDELIARWQARLGEYPEPFRREVIARHWRFFPLWFHDDALLLRDCELWRLDVLLDGAFNVLGVLAALNRLYFARFELKRMRDLVARMELAPPALADRIEALFRLPRADAAREFGILVEETRLLVAAELPELALSLPAPLDERQRPWRL
jgi:predicted nucleotidyltransferase